jgi:hypothetical protein
MAQPMQFEAEEPALAGLAKPRARFAQQAPAPVPHGMTDRQRFRIDQIKGGGRGRPIGGGAQRGPQEGGEGVPETSS